MTLQHENNSKIEDTSTRLALQTIRPIVEGSGLGHLNFLEQLHAVIAEYSQQIAQIVSATIESINQPPSKF